MTRLEILNTFSKFLKGVARPARLPSSDIQYSMVLYARELVRHRLKKSSPNFEIELIKCLDSDLQIMSNCILIKLDKEKKAGGKIWKSEIAERILNNKIIEKTLLKKYKRYFKGSKLTYSNLRSYNHTILLLAVVRGFLDSLSPGTEILESTLVLDFRTNQIIDKGMQRVSFQRQANDFIIQELVKIGIIMEDETCLNRSEVDYFHYSFIPGTSYEFQDPRMGLLPYLNGNRINPLQTIY